MNKDISNCDTHFFYKKYCNISKHQGICNKNNLRFLLFSYRIFIMKNGYNNRLLNKTELSLFEYCFKNLDKIIRRGGRVVEGARLESV